MTQAQQVSARMIDVAPARAQAPVGQEAPLRHRAYLVGFKSKITTVISPTVTSLSARRGQLTIMRTRTAQLQDISAAVAQSGSSGVNHNIVQATDAQQLLAYDGRNRQ